MKFAKVHLSRPAPSYNSDDPRLAATHGTGPSRQNRNFESKARVAGAIDPRRGGRRPRLRLARSRRGQGFRARGGPRRGASRGDQGRPGSREGGREPPRKQDQQEGGVL